MLCIGVPRGRTPVDRYRAALQPYGARVVEIPATDPSLDPDAARQLLQGLDGLLLPGGPDLDPRRYGEQWCHPTVRIDPARDALEVGLTQAAWAAQLPILGICRGIQTLNVAMGGTLWQDLPSEHPSPTVHQEPPQTRDRRRRLHPVQLAPGSRLAAILQCPILSVNSIHHQAVRALPPHLRATAWAPDGIVEAIEAESRPFVIGVQWHPEELCSDDPVQARLFAAFCAAARQG